MKRALQTFFQTLLTAGFLGVFIYVWANVFGIGAAL
jgi:hypothetical protein